MSWFKNYYCCPNDDTEWSDEWDCIRNDHCPVCGADIAPYQSEDLEAVR